MARKSKPVSNEMRMRKLHDSIVRQTVSGMLYSGSSVTRGVQVEGFNRVRRHIKNKAECQELEAIINHILRTRRHQWNVWWAVFISTDVEDSWYHTGDHTFDNVLVSEFDAVFQAHLQDVIDAYRVEYGAETVKGYGWVATHGSIQTILSRSDDLVEQFVDLGVYDSERGNQVILEHKLEKNLLGSGNASVEEVIALRDALARSENPSN